MKGNSNVGKLHSFKGASNRLDKVTKLYKNGGGEWQTCLSGHTYIDFVFICNHVLDR